MWDVMVFVVARWVMVVEEAWVAQKGRDNSMVVLPVGKYVG